MLLFEDRIKIIKKNRSKISLLPFYIESQNSNPAPICLPLYTV